MGSFTDFTKQPITNQINAAALTSIYYIGTLDYIQSSKVTMETEFEISKSSKVSEKGAVTEVKEFQCTFCAKKFPSKNRLYNHTQRHTREKIHECNVCARRFITNSEEFGI